MFDIEERQFDTNMIFRLQLDGVKHSIIQHLIDYNSDLNNKIKDGVEKFFDKHDIVKLIDLKVQNELQTVVENKIYDLLSSFVEGRINTVLNTDENTIRIDSKVKNSINNTIDTLLNRHLDSYISDKIKTIFYNSIDEDKVYTKIFDAIKNFFSTRRER